VETVLTTKRTSFFLVQF